MRNKKLLASLLCLSLTFLFGCQNTNSKSDLENKVTALESELKKLQESKTVSLEENDGEIKDEINENSVTKENSVVSEEKNILKDLNPNLTDTITNLDKLKLFKDDLKDEYKNEVGEEKVYKDGYAYITKTYEEVKQFDEQVVFTKSDSIYPGAIFRGDALKNNEYIPVHLPRSPIDISLSLQGYAAVKSKIENPRVVSSARESINNLLNQEGLEGPAALSFQVREISSSNQLALELGAGIGVGGVTLGFGISPSESFEKNQLFAQFTQRYYSISADRPQYLSGFFEDSVTQEKFLEATNNYMPVYVSNVIYGRRGLFQFESEIKSDTLETSFSAGYGANGIGINGEIKDAISKSMTTSDFKLYILGGNGDTAVNSIDSYDRFVEHIQAGSQFSSQNRGEVIGFELRYLHDGSLAKTVLNDSYTVTTKVPRNRNVKFDVSYIEAESDADTERVRIDRLDIFVDQDSIPLWQNIITGTPTSSLKYTDVYNNSQISFDEIAKARTSQGWSRKSVYYIHKPKNIPYNDPEHDRIGFKVNVGGHFWCKGNLERFNYNSSQEFKIKDIQDGDVLVIECTSQEIPSYGFKIAVVAQVTYDDVSLEKNK